MKSRKSPHSHELRHLVCRILSLYQTSSLTPGSFALRQSPLTDSRISSANPTRMQGFGLSLYASMKGLMFTLSSATERYKSV